LKDCRRINVQKKRVGHMAGYIRKTALSPAEVLERAEAFLPARLGLARTRASSHAATWTGAEGTAEIDAHSHSLYTEVTIRTDRLRTSRMDYEVQKFLNLLPYEPGDRGGPGLGDPSLSPSSHSPAEGRPVS
jgi:hypothetical protein